MRTNKLENGRNIIISEREIVFLSRKKRGYAAVGKINEAGETSAEWVRIKEYSKEKRREKIFSGIITILFNLLPLLILFILLNHILITHREPAFNISLVYVSSAVIIIWPFIVDTIISNKTKGIHGALHMVQNAYEDFERNLSLKEITTYSRFSNMCSDNDYLTFLLVFGALGIAILISGIINNTMNIAIIFDSLDWRLVTSLIVVIFCLAKFLQCYGKMNFLQRFTTTEPSKAEIEATMKAFNLLNEKESLQ